MKSSTWYFLVWCIGFSLITTGLSQLQVVGQKEPIIALLGDDVILPCFLRPSTSAVDQTVEWQRRDLTPKEVHYYSDGRDNPDVHNPVYKGRTRLFEEELKSGNMSLKLTGVKHTDNGFFTCFVPKLVSTVKTSVIQLIVGAVSQPVISVVGPKDYGVVLKCDSGGWFPKPEMTWVDSDGNILPDGSTETETDSEGRYTVRGHVTVQKTDMFTCRVQQQKINHKMETEINVPGGVFPWSRGQKAGLIIGVLALLAVAVLVGLFIWRKQKKEKAELKRELGKWTVLCVVTLWVNKKHPSLAEVCKNKHQVPQNHVGKCVMV
uniref:Ig-like domain-containing protein n=1 Tax=Esox lucius TaxID=8010 RepID=A0AAY5KTR3_ESOLU